MPTRKDLLASHEELRPQTETDFDYAGKYQSPGRIGARLIKGFYRSVESLCQEISPASALEAGCGEGFSTEKLKRMLPSTAPFRALDVEERLVEAAGSRNPDVTVTIGSIYDLQEDDNSIDLIFALEVLEHLEEPRKALSELQRVAKRAVITSVPREPLWRLLNMCRLKYISHFGNTPGHVHHWSKGSFLRLIKEYGEIVTVRKPLPWTVVMWTPVQRSGRNG